MIDLNKVQVDSIESAQLTKNPLVSIVVVTYNHKNFISKCLDNILNQVTDFEFEVIVGDDESNDKTREICIEYAKNYPDKVRLFLHSRVNNIKINGRPTGRFNFLYNLAKVKGKYIALCEGDDFWTDHNKLQKQVDFLENHDECNLVFTKNVFLTTTNEIKDPWNQREELPSQFELVHLLEKGIMPSTHTMMFRRSALPENWPDFMFDSFNGDWILLFLICQNNPIGFINEYTATYREGVGIINAHSNILILKNGMQLNKRLNKYTQGKFGRFLNNYEWHYTRLCYAYLEERNISKGIIYYFKKLIASAQNKKSRLISKQNLRFSKHFVKLLFNKV